MKQTIIGILVVVGAIALGVGGAYGVSRLVPENSKSGVYQDYLNGQNLPDLDGQFRRGMMGRQGFNGHMNRDFYGDRLPSNATRLTIDEAQQKAEEYALKISKNLKVMEVMEFSNNFYAVVVETDTDKGAFELLVDPYTGQTGLEMGPGMMWNGKYGRMRVSDDPSPVNTLTLAQAASKAQDALNIRFPGAKVEEDGIDFYGYYSFDYKVDGKVVGMLSVNGDSGQVSFHFWHDTFINEKEFE